MGHRTSSLRYVDCDELDPEVGLEEIRSVRVWFRAGEAAVFVLSH